MHGKVTTAHCLHMVKQAVVNHIPWLGIRLTKVCVMWAGLVGGDNC